MNRELLCRLLGLASTATDEQINQALAAMNASVDQLKALAGEGVISVAEAVGKLGAKAAKLASLEEVEKTTRKTAAETEVGALVSQKRLQPSMRAFALSIHGTASWADFVASLPGASEAPSTSASPAGSGAGQPPEPTVQRGRAFDAQELAQIKAMGLTEEQARATLARRQTDPFATETL